MSLVIGNKTTVALQAGVWLSDNLAVTTVDQAMSITNRTDGPIYYGTADVAPANIGAAEGSIAAGTTVTGLPVFNALHLYSAAGGDALIGATNQTNDYSPIPRALLTGSRNGTRRLRVDTGQTGFFEGREFRTFLDYTIPASSAITVRLTAPVDFILFDEILVVDAGSVSVGAYGGATSTGTYSTALPIIGKNRMAGRPKPYYTSQVTIATGGAFTGGTLTDIDRITAAQATAIRQSVGGSDRDERGLPAGVYHLRFTNHSAQPATGIFKLFWEERP